MHAMAALMTPPGDSIIRRFMTTPNDSNCQPCGNRCRLPLMLTIVLLAILLFRGFRPAVEHVEQQPAEKTAQVATKPGGSSDVVTLALDFGDGRRQEFPAISWRTGMTVADLFHEVRGVSVTQKGTGTAAFVTGINGVENQRTAGKNWLYEVNGGSGDRSYAVYQLHPDDRVLWTFQPRR